MTLERLRHALHGCEDLEASPMMAKDLEKMERLVGVVLRPSKLRLFAIEWTIDHHPLGEVNPSPEEDPEEVLPPEAPEAPEEVLSLVEALALLLCLFVHCLFFR